MKIDYVTINNVRFMKVTRRDDVVYCNAYVFGNVMFYQWQIDMFEATGVMPERH